MAGIQNIEEGLRTICCVPNFCSVGEPIMMDNLSEAVKVICNNENCSEGQFMHRLCFELWEQSVLTYLKSTGRARSWNEKQRLQNLWTKKGYDLAYKACSCKCGKGHLRKDLNWLPPPAPVLGDPILLKKKKKKKKNDKPALSLCGSSVSRPSMTIGQHVPDNRLRSSSISSVSSTSGSPPNFPVFDSSLSPESIRSDFSYFNTSFFNVKSSGETMIISKEACASAIGSATARERPYSIFCRRHDYSSFNFLPSYKINSYHIKMENEAEYFDERAIIFPMFVARKILGVNCIFCSTHMMIYDRFPLIDGTFFISPQQYSSASIPFIFNGIDQFVNAICMCCLEGSNTILTCNSCHRRWNGGDLVLGTVYTYDVIAAVPCCEEKLKCKNCQMVLPQKKIQFFSHYSRHFLCPYCGVEDFHYIKPISSYTIHRSF